MAFWTCYSDRESKKHKHDFDEYTIIVSGQYTACFEGREIVLNPGDELFVSRNGTVGQMHSWNKVDPCLRW